MLSQFKRSVQANILPEKSVFIAFEQDVGVRDQCDNLVVESLRQLGGLDIIVSNAVGWIARLLQPLEDE